MTSPVKIFLIILVIVTPVSLYSQRKNNAVRESVY